MAGRVEVLKSVRVLRIFATSDMTTGQTHAKLGPARSKREAFLATTRARRDLPNPTYMFARFGIPGHGSAKSRLRSCILVLL
jgi:hypothetical protein